MILGSSEVKVHRITNELKAAPSEHVSSADNIFNVSQHIWYTSVLIVNDLLFV